MVIFLLHLPRRYFLDTQKFDSTVLNEYFLRLCRSDAYPFDVCYPVYDARRMYPSNVCYQLKLTVVPDYSKPSFCFRAAIVARFLSLVCYCDTKTHSLGLFDPIWSFLSNPPFFAFFAISLFSFCLLIPSTQQIF